MPFETLLSRAILLAGLALGAQEPRLPREALIQDARFLGRTLEEAHPDPYTAFGGRIGFHRELQRRIRDLPPEGLTARAFLEHLSPFVAQLRDGHTRLRHPDAASTGPGLPLALRVVGTDLVVAAAAQPELLGARLVSVGGQSLAALRERVLQIRGIENPSGELLNLALLLGSREGLGELLPEARTQTDLPVGLALSDGRLRPVVLALGPVPPGAAALATQVKGLPDMTRRSLGWSFLDNAGETACLAITDSVGYRENIAFYLGLGNARSRQAVEELFRKQHGRAAATDAELAAGFPSALESFADLARAMRDRGTKRLLVDLRENQGGNSLVGKLLVHVLFGTEGLQRANAGYSIIRTSQLLVDNASPGFLDSLNAGRDWPLGLQEYSFAGEEAPRGAEADPKALRASWRRFPALVQEVEHPQVAALFAPPEVVVLCGAATFSAGFDVALALHRNGARLVGTPSAQAPNCFIDLLSFTLPRSGLRGAVSFKASYALPGDPVRGRMLPCDLPLTYAEFQRLGFDAHAEVLLALGTPARVP